MPVSVTPLPLAPDDERVDRLRRAVVDHPGLVTAFAYRRDDGSGPRPALGLVGEPAALEPGSDAVAAVLAAWGARDEVPSVVALSPDLGVLASLLALAPPIGAGGTLEVDLSVAVRSPADTGAGTTALASVVDGAVVVPTEGAGVPARTRGGPALEVQIPAVTAEGTRAVGAFSSLYAMAHAIGSHPATTVAGWAVVESLPTDVHLVVDPALPWAWAPPMPLLRLLARRRPAHRSGPFARG